MDKREPGQTSAFTGVWSVGTNPGHAAVSDWVAARDGMTAEPWTKYMLQGGAGQAADRAGVETPQRLLPEPLRPAPGQFSPRIGPGYLLRVTEAVTTNRNLMLTAAMIVAFLMVPYPPSLPQWKFDIPHCVAGGPRLVNRLFSESLVDEKRYGIIYQKYFVARSGITPRGTSPKRA